MQPLALVFLSLYLVTVTSVPIKLPKESYEVLSAVLESNMKNESLPWYVAQNFSSPGEIKTTSPKDYPYPSYAGNSEPSIPFPSPISTFPPALQGSPYSSYYYRQPPSLAAGHFQPVLLAHTSTSPPPQPAEPPRPVQPNPSKPNKAPVPGIPNKKDGPPPASPRLLFPLSSPPVPLPAEECLTADDEVGECLSAHDCGQTNGQMSGLCHQGMDHSAYPRVCCTYTAECGYSTSKTVSYFRSPAWPQLVTNHSDCSLEVDVNPGVCQVRLDFIDFHLDGMTEGSCSPSNQMVINSTIKHAYFPTNTLCGNLSPTTAELVDYLRTDLPHLYLHLEDLPADRKVPKLPNSPTPSISLNVKVTNHPSKWNIRVTQIQCDGAPLQAPGGCSQYYNSFSGTMTSLNYHDNQYMTNMDMAACVRLDQRACAIAYTIDSMSVGASKGNKLGYGLTCGDYISFSGEKTGMCGTALAREVVLPVRGVQGVTMHSDSVFSKSEAGFKMQYRYIRECVGLQYFRYPQPK
eukprot:GFUD01031908.1.p1 GENE.GFUD01031908.1~~GFUD01031908.1.p1  ORF type:complete len:518 (+),score=114.79 GFUD01031908.1:75-1628(+)